MGYGLATEGKTGGAGLGLGLSKGVSFTPKRVISVIMDNSHPYYISFKDIGKVYFEDPYNGNFNTLHEAQKIVPSDYALPITPGNQLIPLIGEIVFVLSTVGKKRRNNQGVPGDEKYYFPPIRLSNQSEHNSFHIKYPNKGITGGEKVNRAVSGTPNKAKPSEAPVAKFGEYWTEKNIKRLLPYEGDYIIEGRFGNSIRFGSTTPFMGEKGPLPNNWSNGTLPGKSTVDETEAQVGDPITIIRNGQTEVVPENELAPMIEDINGDHSSIYLCSNQRLSNLKVAGQTNPVEQKSYLADEQLGTAGNDKALSSYMDYVNDLSKAMPDPSGNYYGFNQGNTGVADRVLFTEMEITAPVLAMTMSTYQDDQTDDGISFYEEMVVNSSVANPDDFIEEIVQYENVYVSGTELSEDELKLENNLNINDDGTLGEMLPKPSGYPCNIPCRKNNKFSTQLHTPINAQEMAIKVRREGKAGGEKKHLVIHTSAMGYGSTHIDVHHYFMQSNDGDKPWTRTGYHITIEKDGSCVKTHPDKFNTYGVGMPGKGNNKSHLTDEPVGNNTSIHITWLGGAGSVWDMTREQAAAIKILVKAYIEKYPNIEILGHNQIAEKACPIFYVPEFLKEIGVKTRNVWGNSYTGAVNENKGANSSQYKANALQAANITDLKTGA